MKCPYCGSLHFYLKDPEDEYDIHEFVIREERVCFEPDDDEASPEIRSESEIFCNQCSWHGKLTEIG